LKPAIFHLALTGQIVILYLEKIEPD